MSDSARAPTLEEQIIEVEKEIRDRERYRYPALIERGRLTRETAAVKMAALRAVHDTLMWLDTNAAWIKAEAAARRRLAAQRRELAEVTAEMRSQPVVAALLDTFPGAEIVGVAPLPAPSTQPQEESSL